MVIAEPVALFIFAHQDDEFGVFQKIIDERRKGHRVCCAYLTNGGFKGVSPLRRNQESRFVLQSLGVCGQDIFFAGHDLAIPDAHLYQHLVVAADWIKGWLQDYSNIISIFIPAWEGGHHDHDALHAIMVRIAVKEGILGRVRQFPLYNAYGCAGPFFKVLTPLPMNGEIEKIRIPWNHRIRFLWYCLCYPSQALSWIGIFPFVVFHYLRNGNQALQPASYERTCHRPHDGPLYYEKRGFLTWEKMSSCLSEWRIA